MGRGALGVPRYQGVEGDRSVSAVKGDTKIDQGMALLVIFMAVGFAIVYL